MIIPYFQPSKMKFVWLINFSRYWGFLDQLYLQLLLMLDSLSIYINDWCRMQWSGKHNFVYFVYSYFNKIPIVVNRKFFVKMNYNSYHLLFPPKSIEFLWFGFWSKRKKGQNKVTYNRLIFVLIGNSTSVLYVRTYPLNYLLYRVS